MAETFAEIGRVEAIRRLFEGSGYAAFEAPLSVGGEGDGSAVAASRLLLEGTDFSLVYFPLKHLGYKSVVSVTAELYAAMARPRTLSITLGISSKLDYEQVSELWSGVLVAAKEHGYEHLSLDLVPSRNGLAISIAAEGFRKASTEEKRPAPASKDLICVSGSLGSAYFGQQVLEHKPDELETLKNADDYMTVRFTCDRAIANELVRHRVFSFSQESTRYVNYEKRELAFVRPIPFEWAELSVDQAELSDCMADPRFQTWILGCEQAEDNYLHLIREGCHPQEARAVLPLSVKTELIMTGTFPQWSEMLKLRLHHSAHPQMRYLMQMLIAKKDFPASRIQLTGKEGK